MEQKSNLFRLAKKNGFKVIVISVQTRENFNLVQNNAIDILITLEDIKKTAKHDDDYLLDLLKEKVNLNEGKNFVILHQRSAHTPYDNSCPDFGFKIFYDNCVFYNDSIYKETLSYLKTTKIPFYYFITSDHGEMLGQDGLYGHNFLNLDVAKIPMFLYTNDKNRSVFNEFKDIHNPTNYEMGIMIAKLLSWSIENPNTPDNIYYISSQYRIKGDYIKIEKEGKEIKTSIVKID
ncbi:MAG: hypothetical protein Ta2D_09130 [Rickettsiales bacterium]|nr:MAG: hypothetical protein Ta2D_09130 [Rickettsiales bacterium]